MSVKKKQKYPTSNDLFVQYLGKKYLIENKVNNLSNLIDVNDYVVAMK